MSPRIIGASSTKLHSKENANEAPMERIRAAVFQAPPQSTKTSENPLEILTEVADSLRVASMHGVDIVLFPELYLTGGGPKRAIDRESYELNIVGNMCGELNVACIIGYAEEVHESELKNRDDPDGGKGAYNSIAAFHADGSRAANYRCVSVSRGRAGIAAHARVGDARGCQKEVVAKIRGVERG